MKVFFICQECLRGFVIAALLPAIALGQSTKDAEKSLRGSLLKKPMIPRGFSSDAEIHWRWDGDAFVMTPPTSHTLGVLIPGSVKLKGDRIEIKGNRHTLLHDDKGALLSSVSRPVNLVIDFAGGERNEVLPKLMQALFYKDVPDALAALPARYRTMLPMRITCCDKPKPVAAKLDCTDRAPGASDLSMDGMKLPAVVHQQEADFSYEARTQKFNGNVAVAMLVDTSGHIADVWLGRPAGMGLDENAVKAAQKYVFKPATCHGNAVDVVLMLDVNFSIF